MKTKTGRFCDNGAYNDIERMLWQISSGKFAVVQIDVVIRCADDPEALIVVAQRERRSGFN